MLKNFKEKALKLIAENWGMSVTVVGALLGTVVLFLPTSVVKGILLCAIAAASFQLYKSRR